MVAKLFNAPYKPAPEKKDEPPNDGTPDKGLAPPTDHAQVYEAAALTSAQGMPFKVITFPTDIDAPPPGVVYVHDAFPELTKPQADLVIRHARDLEIGAITETGHRLGSLDWIWAKFAKAGKRAALQMGMLPAMTKPGGGTVRAVLTTTPEGVAKLNRLIKPPRKRRGPQNDPLKHEIAIEYRARIAGSTFAKLKPWPQAEILYDWNLREFGRRRAKPIKTIDRWIRKGEL